MFKKLMNKLKRRSLKDENFEFLFDNPPHDEYVSLDCETTGLNPKKDEILSIGAVIIKKNKILMRETFNIFVKPSGGINSESIKIHQIRPVDLENAVDPKDAILQLLHFIGSRPIIGYYIKFDIAIISKYTKQYIGISLPNLQIEVSSMYFKTKKRRSEYEFVDLKFDTIMSELEIPELGKHDALNDAIMTSMIFLKLKDKAPANSTFYTG